MISPSLLFAQQSANLGIFDATADWGLEPEFPPQLGQYKVPGRVEVSEVDGDYVYDIYGNGDQIHGKNDEGFYAYTQKKGSWTLSGKIQWMDTGDNPGQGPKAGFMVREQGKDSKAKHFTIILFGKIERSISKTNWRSQTSGSANAYNIKNPDGSDIAQTGEPVYLRVTCIALHNLFFAEWSLDGTLWNFAHQFRMEMDSTAAYGIAITNQNDNQELAHVQVSDLKLEPAQPFAIRLFPSDRFAKSEPLNVLLRLINPQPAALQVFITENIPNSWSAKNISHEGMAADGVVTWDITAQPGSTLLEYSVVPSDDSGSTAVFSGKVNSTSIVGVSELYQSILPIASLLNETFHRTLIVTFLIAISFLHLCLFLFYPQNKSNLYFSLFLIFSSAYLYFGYLLDTQTSGIDRISLWKLFFTSLAISSLMLLQYFHSLVYQKRIKLFWVFLVMSVISLIPLWYTFYFEILWVITGLVCVECFRVILLSVKRRIEGTVIIAFGFSQFSLVVLWQLLSFFGIAPPFPTNRLDKWSLLIFILSMSIYLAYRFAKTTKNLQILNVELEDRVERRTASLEEANEELRELDKMKSAFLSQASHDLRTPLTAIKGSLDNVLMGIGGGLSEKQQTVLTRASTSVNRLGKLINDVLDLNRIESGRATIEKTSLI